MKLALKFWLVYRLQLNLKIIQVLELYYMEKLLLILNLKTIFFSAQFNVMVRA